MGEVKITRYSEEYVKQWRPKQGKSEQEKQKEEEKKEEAGKRQEEKEQKKKEKIKKRKDDEGKEDGRGMGDLGQGRGDSKIRSKSKETSTRKISQVNLYI